MRYVIVFAFLTTLCLATSSHAVAVPPTISVAAGESIQKAIDAAPDGATIQIAAGTFGEYLVISKPLTLAGAGWDKTIVRPDKGVQRTQAEKDAFFKKLDAAATREERVKLAMEIAGVVQRPSIVVRSTDGVLLKDLKIQGMAMTSNGRELAADTLVIFESSHASMNNCAVVGPFMNGVQVINGSDVQIDHCLVAGLWNTGVAVYSGERGERGTKPAKLHLSNSDIRNCYSRCVTVSCEGSTIEKCMISGSAWHGIRYDNCSPTITGNHIFANARCGIYASGNTAAVVRDNFFVKNEMSGISCWFNNADTIEQNRFVDNLREGLGVLGASKPAVTKNVFLRNPVAIDISKINGDRNDGPADPKFDGNTFWQNKIDVQLLAKQQPAPAGSLSEDPKLADAAIAPKSDWPVQAEEAAIIPDSETRDYSKWKTARAE